MDLSEFLGGERGRCARFAMSLGIAPAYLSQMATRRRPVPPDVAPELERLCARNVRLWDLRPDDWHRIWPELIGTEGAPAVPVLATETSDAG